MAQKFEIGEFCDASESRTVRSEKYFCTSVACRTTAVAVVLKDANLKDDVISLQQSHPLVSCPDVVNTGNDTLRQHHPRTDWRIMMPILMFI